MNIQAIKNGLLKYAIMINGKDKPVVFKRFYQKNSKNEVAASRIFIR